MSANKRRAHGIANQMPTPLDSTPICPSITARLVGARRAFAKSPPCAGTNTYEYIPKIGCVDFGMHLFSDHMGDANVEILNLNPRSRFRGQRTRLYSERARPGRTRQHKRQYVRTRPRSDHGMSRRAALPEERLNLRARHTLHADACRCTLAALELAAPSKLSSRGHHHVTGVTGALSKAHCMLVHLPQHQHKYSPESRPREMS